jgi:hypothetical protein
MATTEEYTFVLSPCSTRRLGFNAACINASRPIPGAGDSFHGIRKVPDKVARFLEISKGIDPMAIQAGVWTLTDNYSRSEVIKHLVTRDVFGKTTYPITHYHCDRAAIILDEIGISHRLWPSPLIDKIQIKSFGIYQARIKGLTSDPNTASGFSNDLDGISLDEQTDRIPVQKGLTFGVTILPVGNGYTKLPGFKEVWRFPAPGLKNPDTGKTHLSDERRVWLSVNVATNLVYTFDSDFEMIPGQWFFEIWYGDRKLATQEFNMEAR